MCYGGSSSCSAVSHVPLLAPATEVVAGPPGQVLWQQQGQSSLAVMAWWPWMLQQFLGRMQVWRNSSQLLFLALRKVQRSE